MTKQGWVAIYRQIQDHWLWEDKPFSKQAAWIDMLLLANHDDNKFLLGNELVEVKCGSFISSIEKLKHRWGWSNTKVINFLKLLENDEMVIKKSDTKKTVITIVNYGDYANSKKTKTMPKRYENDTKTIRKHTNNNDNNENNDNKYIYTDIPELEKALVEFVDYRKKIKKPLTDRGVELIIKKLNSMTTSIEEQTEIINQSIVNGWQGIFPLKKEKVQKANKDFGGSYDLNEFEKRLNDDDKPKSEYDSFMDQLANMREE